jgi:S1-C subfamily serine protease
MTPMPVRRACICLLLCTGPLISCASHPAAPVASSQTSNGRPLLGIVPDLASEDSRVGVLIAGTTPGTPAETGGLQAGDLLVGFGDQAVQNLTDLTQLLEHSHPGDKVHITVLRADKKIVTDVTLGTWTE